ncbi:MAG: TetR family transcriptional regulator [Deltaproteobacteria bacterium]|nr:TetR family transcriptional regulator [Deltaproteobacteria bacterium]
MVDTASKSGFQKAKMLSVARKLFWEKGYNATGMRDIAKAYGCKPANIYNFFVNKEEILFQVLREEMEKILDPIRHLEEDQETPPLEQLREIIYVHLKITLSYRRSAGLLFDATLDKLSPPKRKIIVEYRDLYDCILRKVIQRGIDAGYFHKTNVKLAGFMIASMITRSRVWFHPKKGVNVDELADFIFQFTCHGLMGKDAAKTSGQAEHRPSGISGVSA